MVENLPNATTTTYEIEFEHFHEEGIAVSPISGKGPQNSSLVRLHAPIESIIVYYSAVREGAPPILPSHKSYLSNPNRLFIRGKRVGVVTPTLGGHIFTVYGFWQFALCAPENMDSNFPLSLCPWETGLQLSDFFIPSMNFQTGVLNPMAQPTGIAADPDAQLLNLQLQNPLSA